MQPSVIDSKRPAGWLALIGVTLITPFLYAAAFPKTNFVPLAFVALVPIFWLWSKSSWKIAFWFGWLLGGMTVALLGSWAITSLGDYIGPWAFLGIVVLGVVEGFSAAVLAAVISLACRGSFGAAAVFAAPAAFMLPEFIRTQGPLGIPFGELGLVAVHVPWLLPVASFAGVYGVSALLALVNGAIAGLVFGTRGARVTGAAVLVVAAAVVVATNVNRASVAVPEPTITIGVAQGNVSQRVKWTKAVFAHTLDTYEALTRRAAQSGATIVVWPETAITAHPLQEPALFARLDHLATSQRVWIIAGTLDLVSYPPEVDYNSAIALSPSGQFAGSYRKHILVPFAEYLPADHYLRGLPLFDQASRFWSGTGPGALQADGARLGMLICYESAFAQYVRDTANVSDALVVITDDAWFGNSSGPFQHADMSIMDAVETGHWVVRGGDTGISEIIDPKGVVTAYLPLNQEGYITGKVGPPIPTLYSNIGDRWFIWPILVALAAGFVRFRRASVPA